MSNVDAVPKSSVVDMGEIKAERRRQQAVQLAVRMVLVLIAVAYALFPVLYIFSSSLDPRNSISSAGLIPDFANASLDNYEELVNSDIYQYERWVFNSVVVSIVAAILAVMVSALAAYAFSRFRFRGRKGLMLTIFLVQVFPNSLTIVATFLLIQEIGTHIPAFGLNSYGGLILVYLGGALGINTWLMKGFFDSIPRDLDEAAMIDGASHWRTFWTIIFPLVRPILAVVGILTFVGTYNDYIIAKTLLKEGDYYTLAVGLDLLIADQYGQQWGTFAAGALLGAIPVVIIYLIMQDYLVGGLTQGAVKG